MHDTDSEPLVDPDVIATLRELGGSGDPGLLVEVIDLFLQDADAHVGSLRRALEQGDLKLLERTAHTLKSSSANVGALSFSRLCFEIEKLGRASSSEGLAELVERVQRRYPDVRAALEAAKH